MNDTQDVKTARRTASAPVPCSGFGVCRRNYGHWDIISNSSRIFRVRGGPGKYVVLDERDEGERKCDATFKTVGACMGYICDELMFELIVAEGQTPTTIERWNI